MQYYDISTGVFKYFGCVQKENYFGRPQARYASEWTLSELVFVLPSLSALEVDRA